MKMKLLIVLAASALLLFSCYWTPEGAQEEGELTLTIDAGGTKAPEEDYARIYLLSGDNNLIKIGDGKAYQEVELGGETVVTIQGLDPSLTYTVLLAVGEKVGNGFEIAKYAEESGVTVVAGENKDVEVDIENSPFVYASFLTGNDVTGVVVDSQGDDSIYTATKGNIFKVNTSLGQAGGWTMPSGYEANSLSYVASGAYVASDRIFVNTNKGIVPFASGSFATAFSAPLRAKYGNIPVTDSGYYSNGLGDEVIYFQRDGGLGGTDMDGAVADWKWVNVDLSENLAGEPIIDVEDTGEEGYWASLFGAFRLDATFFSDPERDVLLDYATFVEPEASGELMVVSSFGFDGGTNFFIGTMDGVWWNDNYTAGEEDVDVGNRIGVTKGHRFLRVNATSDYAVFLSRYYLWIWNIDEEELTKIPFVAGLPGYAGDVSGMAWKTIGGDTWLLISGVKGLVGINASEY